MNKRVGIFGGTFDPIHNAHMALAHAALQALALQEVRFIPAGQPWQKQNAVSAAQHRVAMTTLAIEGEARFVLDRREVDRAGASYTLDTVRELVAEHPSHGWVLMIGADQYAALHTWRDWQTLLGLVTLAVANRPGVLQQADPAVQRFSHKVALNRVLTFLRWCHRRWRAILKPTTFIDFESTHRQELNGHQKTATRHRRWPGRCEGAAHQRLQHRTFVGPV
jgi:nicotinate-nucleotide adenylyltransferase